MVPLPHAPYLSSPPVLPQPTFQKIGGSFLFFGKNRLQFCNLSPNPIRRRPHFPSRHRHRAACLRLHPVAAGPARPLVTPSVANAPVLRSPAQLLAICLRLFQLGRGTNTHRPPDSPSRCEIQVPAMTMRVWSVGIYSSAICLSS
jgi:hypothetical protein